MSRTRRLSELSMMATIPIIINATKNNKLDGMLRKMHNIALRQLKAMYGSGSDIERTVTKLQIWGERSGWLHNSNHSIALVSFGLCLLENSPENYGKEMNDLTYCLSKHIRKAGNLLTKEQIGGQEAIDDWSQLYTTKPPKETINDAVTIH